MDTTMIYVIYLKFKIESNTCFVFLYSTTLTKEYAILLD